MYLTNAPESENLEARDRPALTLPDQLVAQVRDVVEDWCGGNRANTGDDLRGDYDLLAATLWPIFRSAARSSSVTPKCADSALI